jgi:hypothetical protein
LLKKRRFKWRMIYSVIINEPPFVLILIFRRAVKLFSVSILVTLKSHDAIVVWLFV